MAQHKTFMRRRTMGDAGDANAIEQEAWELELVRRAHADDRDAFGELLLLYQPRVFSLVRRLVPRQEEAVELTQEAFLQAFKSRQRFEPGRAFRPWLFKIAVNVCRNYRRARARGEYASEMQDVADTLWGQASESPEALAADGDTRRMLERYLSKLGEADRGLLLLRFVEDMSYAELRAVYARPQAVLKMRVHRALQRLRAIAAEELQ